MNEFLCNCFKSLSIIIKLSNKNIGKHKIKGCCEIVAVSLLNKIWLSTLHKIIGTKTYPKLQHHNPSILHISLDAHIDYDMS